MPQYEFKCTKCGCFEIISATFSEFDDIKAAGGACCYARTPDDESWCAGKMERCFSPGSLQIRTSPTRIGELMEKDSWARNHTMPKEWFDQQTRQKQEETRKREYKELKETGRLAQVNQQRKSIGLDPI